MEESKTLHTKFFFLYSSEFFFQAFLKYIASHTAQNFRRRPWRLKRCQTSREKIIEMRRENLLFIFNFTDFSFSTQMRVRFVLLRVSARSLSVSVRAISSSTVVRHLIEIKHMC